MVAMARAGMDVTVADPQGATALHIAAFDGFAECVTALCNVSLFPVFFSVPLCLAPSI